jgi:hypothetical protein
MKKSFLTIGLLLYSFLLHAQIDLRGTDFWLTFGKNTVETYETNKEVNLQIRIVSSEQATTGNIYFTNLGYSVPFSIAGGKVLSARKVRYFSVFGTLNRLFSYLFRIKMEGFC